MGIIKTLSSIILRTINPIYNTRIVFYFVFQSPNYSFFGLNKNINVVVNNVEVDIVTHQFSLPNQTIKECTVPTTILGCCEYGMGNRIEILVQNTIIIFEIVLVKDIILMVIVKNVVIILEVKNIQINLFDPHQS